MGIDRKEGIGVLGMVGMDRIGFANLDRVGSQSLADMDRIGG